MELRIDQELLAHALHRVAGVVKRGGPMPILASVLLSADPGGPLWVCGSDGDVFISGKYECGVTKSGCVVLRHKELYDIVRALPKGLVTLRTTPAHKARLEIGKSTFNLSGESGAEYPALPQAEAKLFEIDADTLLDLLGQTEHAISGDETRPELNGIYLDASLGVLRLVAADGHRLAKAERVCGGTLGAGGVIIPRKAAHELKRLLADEDGAVRLGFTSSLMVFEGRHVRLVSRLSAGLFPDYERVIPRETPNRLVFDRDAMIETVERLSTLASGAVRFDLSAGSKEARLSVQNPDLGDAEESLDVGYEGDTLAVAFNGKYLLDALRALDAPRASIGLGDEMAPALLRPEGGRGFTAIIMPMRCGN